MSSSSSSSEPDDIDAKLLQKDMDDCIDQLCYPKGNYIDLKPYKYVYQHKLYIVYIDAENRLMHLYALLNMVFGPEIAHKIYMSTKSETYVIDRVGKDYDSRVSSILKKFCGNDEVTYKSYMEKWNFFLNYWETGTKAMFKSVLSDKFNFENEMERRMKPIYEYIDTFLDHNETKYDDETIASYNNSVLNVIHNLSGKLKKYNKRVRTD